MYYNKEYFFYFFFCRSQISIKIYEIKLILVIFSSFWCEEKYLSREKKLNAAKNKFLRVFLRYFNAVVNLKSVFIRESEIRRSFNFNNIIMKGTFLIVLINIFLQHEPSRGVHLQCEFRIIAKNCESEANLKKFLNFSVSTLI